MTEAENMRGCVDFIFRNKYAKEYSPERLNGPNGIVHSICKDMGYFQPAGVRRIIIKVYAAMQEQKEFDRKKKKYENETRRLIQKGTYEHHLLTVLKESNNSFKQCTEGFNALHSAKNGLPPVSITAVYNAINLCNYQKTKTKKAMQTNINNKIYRQARYNWIAQLLARMGQPVPEIMNKNSEYRMRLKDEWVNYDKLKDKGLTFSLDQVAFWDECHIKQVAGTCFDETLIFARDEHGVYDDNAEVNLEGNEKVS